MEITEQKLLEAFGVKGEKEDGAADHPDAESETDPSEPEGTAEGEQIAGEGKPATGGTHGSESEGGEPKQGEQTLEQRRENAARRRKAEQQKAIDDAVKAAVESERAKSAAEMADFFSGAGLTNTVTGEPIKTMDDYRKWQSDFSKASTERKLQTGEIDGDLIEKMIEDNPVMKKAKAIIEREEAKADEVRQEMARERMEKDLAYIRVYEPQVKTVADLTTIENAEAFADYVRRGNTFADAYVLANRDKIARAAAEVAASAEAAKAGSKSHMVKVGSSRGAGTDPVPKDDMKMFRLFLPEASDEEVAAYYNKYKESKG